MKTSRILLALGLSLALVVPTATFAATLDLGAWKEKWMAMADTSPYADKIAAAIAAGDTADRDFWLKCTFHKTDACDAAMAAMMAK